VAGLLLPSFWIIIRFSATKRAGSTPDVTT